MSMQSNTMLKEESLYQSVVCLFQEPWVRNLLVILHDAFIAGMSVVLAYVLRLGLSQMSQYSMQTTVLNAIIFAAISVAVFFLLKINRRLWRYATMQDLQLLAFGALGSILIFYLIMFGVYRLEGVPRSVPFIQWPVLVMLLGGSRFLRRTIYERRNNVGARPSRGSISVPVAVVGTGPRASMFIRAAHANVWGPHRPVAAIGIDRVHSNRLIDGVPILGGLDSLREHVEHLSKSAQKPRWLVICDDLSPEMIGHLVSEGRSLGIKIAMTPKLNTFEEATLDRRSELRPIAIEDLLARPEVRLDLKSIRILLNGRRILVTGGGGSIGSELCRQIARHNPTELIIMDSSEYNLYRIDQELRTSYPKLKITISLTDVRQGEVVRRKFGQFRPDLVFHGAALKHVPLVEGNPLEGIATNVFGTRNVADAAAHVGALGVVLISTDKAVRPTSVMGATKRLAEIYCQAKESGFGKDQATRFMTVRFGNVLGSSGSVVPLFKQQIAAGGPITVTHPDVTRYFMTINEAVGLVLQAAAHSIGRNDTGGQISVLDMGEPVKIYDMACHIVRLAGLEPGKDIKIDVVGLRPGEKLHEQLFAPEEAMTTADVAIDGVFLVSSSSPNPVVLKRALDGLGSAIQRDDVASAMTILSSLVPGYKHDASGKVAAA